MFCLLSSDTLQALLYVFPSSGLKSFAFMDVVILVRLETVCLTYPMLKKTKSICSFRNIKYDSFKWQNFSQPLLSSLKKKYKLN